MVSLGILLAIFNYLLKKIKVSALFAKLRLFKQYNYKNLPSYILSGIIGG